MQDELGCFVQGIVVVVFEGQFGGVEMVGVVVDQIDDCVEFGGCFGSYGGVIDKVVFDYR